jgi:hypothetical protein
MEPDELAAWQEANGRLVGRSGLRREDRPCADCPLGYSLEMRAQGRCNGTPAGVEEDIEVDAPETPTPPRSLPVARRVALDVAAPPCESCAHEPVCGLRAALEGIADVETTAPALPAGLSLTLNAVVSCGHFLRDRARPAPVRVLTPEQRGQANSVGVGRRAPRQISDATREKMRASAIAARARKAAAEA